METSNLTDERLAELEAMAKAADKGVARARALLFGGEVLVLTQEERKLSSQFHIHSQTIALSLVAEVKRLRAELDKSRRLTAAVPDLLAALARTVGELDVAAGYVRSAGASEHAKACSMAIRKAKAAIAKAKGEA